MTDSTPERFTTELTKNAHKGAWYELIGAGVGGGIGGFIAAGRKLKGIEFFAKTFDFAFMGWMFGLIGRLWTERSNNQYSALQLDSKMMNLEHENAWLKKNVEELGGQVQEYKDDHAEKLKAKANEEKSCGCHVKQ